MAKLILSRLEASSNLPKHTVLGVLCTSLSSLRSQRDDIAKIRVLKLNVFLSGVT